eukprot:CAMPEP_0118931548 /NCGR_PEP_ID=MMETSP1169-20130426/7850_1 /TAXON_ID=36882 /ORGANISM="Pyramimonas obovata, Strain CCMP722" /LENGTH=238 /DNA_ID=CAMNT_0006874059 /DNA_START=195 /DNA_END=911 /DNA_ORIENTATION=+
MPKEKLRILCLHGFRTSGRILQTLFRRSNFEQVFEDHAELVFVNAPYQCNEEEQSRIPAVLQTMFPGPYHEWWNAQEDLTYLRWEASAEYLRRYMCEHGPFDGVLGFSQGGSMASVVHLLQQEGARGFDEVEPLRFLILMSSARARDPQLAPLYDRSPRSTIPVLGFIGEKDTDVPPAATEDLLQSFVDPLVVRSPGLKHAIPKLDEEQKAVVAAYLQAQLTRKHELSGGVSSAAAAL